MTAFPRLSEWALDAAALALLLAFGAVLYLATPAPLWATGGAP